MSIDDLSGRSIGPYRLENVLGLGAMGAVYRAHQPALERDVAVKVLPAALAARQDSQARFIREAKIAASLEHPHIVPLYDYGTDHGMSYVVMRLLTGGTLAERLNARALARGVLPSLSETSTMLTQIAGALDYAHRKGVVHRDIKPNNIMFDDEGRAYVVDFGIAKLMNATTAITGEQSVFGTPHYMPPEQWRDETLVPESDQYALAVVIFSMVTGQPPFDAPTPHALMYKHFHDDSPPPSSLRKNLPPDVDAVLARALSKTPEARYETVGAFASAFAAAVADVEPRSTAFFTFPLPPTGGQPTQPPLAVTKAPAQPPVSPQATVQPPREPVAPTLPANPPVQPPVLPRPPAAAYPVAPSQPAATPHAARPERRESRVSPLFAGVGLGLALLALVVCGGGALVASQLGVFDNAPVATEPAPMPTTGDADTDATTVETPDGEPRPTDLPLPGDTPLPGTAIAAGNVGNLDQTALMAHGTLPVRGVAFQPNGDTVATGAADGTIYVWDRSGNPRGQTSSSGSVIYGLAYSADGRWLASAHEDGAVRLWDAASLAQTAVLRGHNAPVRGIAFSPDSRTIASAGEDETVRLWDVATQAQTRQFDGLPQRVLAVAFSPDSARVAAASESGTARIWDANSGAQVASVSAGVALRAVAFSPSGDRLATAGADGGVRIWDATNGDLLQTLTGHSGEVWAVTYSPDGALIATGGRDNTARLWDATTGRQMTVLRGHGGWVLSVAFSADGSQLATGSGDGTARLWDVTAG